MKKLLAFTQRKRLRTASHTHEETEVSASEIRSHQPYPELDALFRDRERYGLRAIPPNPLDPTRGTSRFDVNVVAVHGLGGDFCKTWTYVREDGPGHDVFWLSQLLPSDLPGARIYSFGYASEPVFSRSVASVKECARQLLLCLSALPEEERSRPTIFVCHSLGGILVKQAIVTAHEDKQFAEVLKAARAIMFMGTPHRGSAIAAAMSPLAKTANFWLGISRTSALTGSMRTDLIQMLTRDSMALGDINESFLPRAQNLAIITCSEMKIPFGLQQRVVEPSSALLQIPGEVVIPLNADHMSMCRFSSSKDPNYQLVSSALVKTSRSLDCSAAHASQRFSAHPSMRSLTESELRYVTKIKTTYRPIIDQRVDGTCVWSLQSPEYQHWRAIQLSTVLWITGEAGCGKTIITAFLFDTLEQSKAVSRNPQQGDVVCSFFCAKNVETQKDARSILRGLLVQILLSRKDFIHSIKSSFDSAKHEFDQSFEALWKVFRFTIEEIPCKCLYIVIDALDECDQDSREQILFRFSQLLEGWHKSSTTELKTLKLIISGQPQILTSWNAVAAAASPYEVIRIQDRPEGMVQDVTRFIDHKVDHLVANLMLTAAFGDRLKKTLYPLAENSFLWVSVVLNHIKVSFAYREVSIARMLTNPPRSLYETYARYLPIVQDHNVSITRQYIRLLVACIRPLTWREMYILASAEENPAESPTDDERDRIFRNSLERALGPLVRFADGYVHFVHSTVRDFFLDLGTNFPHPLSTSHATDLRSAHLAMATACARYLLLEVFSTDLYNAEEDETTQPLPNSASAASSRHSSDGVELPSDFFSIHDVGFLKDETSLQQGLCAEIRSRHAAFDYAACNWAHHLAQCNPDVSEDLLQEVVSLLDPGTAYFCNWYRYMANESRSAMPDITELDNFVIAALFNFHGSLSRLLSEHKAVPQSTLQKALFWAASKGHVASAKVLLEYSPSCAVSERGLTPLAVAVQAGHRDICALILEHGDIDPNFYSTDCRPPLVLAAACNHQSILRLLLAQVGIKVDQIDAWGYTPLLEASKSASMECLQILLADGRADVNKADPEERTALIHSSMRGNASMIRLLLNQAGIQKDKRDYLGRNAVSYAAKSGHLHAVQALLRAKASISASDHRGRNAISWAANSTKASTPNDVGQSVLRLLVEASRVDADVIDEDGWTPLAWAMESPGYLNSVKTLVEVGHVNINQCDRTSGRPILAWAAEGGMIAIVDYLLQLPTLEKNLTDYEGCSALAYAARSGALEVVERLLKEDDIIADLPDQHGRTPRDWARLNQHDDIVVCLEEHLKLQA